MPKHKTSKITPEAARQIEEVIRWDIAGWAEEFARGVVGDDPSAAVAAGLDEQLRLLRDRDEAIEAQTSGKISARIVAQYGAEALANAADAAAEAGAARADEGNLEALAAKPRGRHVTVRVPESLEAAAELVDIGRRGSKEITRLAVVLAKAIIDEHDSQAAPLRIAA